MHLAAQGLLKSQRGRATKADVLAAIERMQLLQIDTIHVVARSPYFVLWSRLGDYRPEWLDELLAEAAIFETWAHEACFAPMADWALLRAHVGDKHHHWAIRNAHRIHREQRAGMDKLLAHVRANGPVRSADFAREQASRGAGGWWGWKNEKRWLEAWFALGELMVARRENFQRVYDLRERVLARTAWHRGDAPASGAGEIDRMLTLKAAHALGIAQAGWLADYYRNGRRRSDADLEPLVADGSLLRVEVRGWDVPGYVHADHRPLLDAALAGRLRPSLTTLLSPFDPVVWDRERARELFDFDYRLECYTPAPKRRYGYFVLPILHRGRLVGRLDAKAHRKDGVFEIKSLVLEEGERVGAGLIDAIAATIARCARWHGASRVTYARVQPRELLVPLRRATASSIIE